ncbi:MAG: shikimate dehydrogenase [Actinomycetota bacterium]|nr:shikimate dehydrogenase [Actinomycetota bacterium]
MADGPARRRAGVLGSPIAHSLSPTLHRAAYVSLALDWDYRGYEVDEARLPGFLAGLDATWAGLSLTMPLKESVIGLLDSIDPVAAAVRAVNTVLPAEPKRRGTLAWHGTNTDVIGMVESLQRAGLAGRPTTASVIGAGATARSAVAALALLGVTEVTVYARRREAADDVAVVASTLGLAAHAAGPLPDAEALSADVVVAALPGDAGAPWAPLAPAASGALLDVSYHPWPTALASAWGSPVVASGRDLLLWQAVEQVRLMTGRDPDAEAMSAALPD